MIERFEAAAGEFELDRAGAAAVVGLRLTIGWVFLHSGLGKLADGLTYSYASTYLSEAAPVATPGVALTFPEVLGAPGALLVQALAPVANLIFPILADMPYIGTLVIFTEIAIGLSLILGAFTRLGSYAGAFMMFLFFFGNADWEHGLMNADAIRLIVFLAVAAMGAGRICGVDRYLEERAFVQERPWLRYLLG